MTILNQDPPNNYHTHSVQHALNTLNHQTALLFHEHSRWINPADAIARLSFKWLQLKTASESGMMILTTFCSIDPEEISAFLQTNQDNGILHTPLFTNNTDHMNTSQVPSLFQKKVTMTHRVRVICFGKALMALKWRADAVDTSPTEIEPYVVSHDLTCSIHHFMHKMMLVFATIDFIITPQQTFIFMDVKAKKDFLWIKAHQLSLNTLEKIVDFLTNCNNHDQ